MYHPFQIRPWCGFPVEAACRIVILEDQLEEALRINAEYRRADESANPAASS